MYNEYSHTLNEQQCTTKDDGHVYIKHLTQTIVFIHSLILFCQSIIQYITKNTAVGGQPPQYASAQACMWWHDIRHVLYGIVEFNVPLDTV